MTLRRRLIGLFTLLGLLVLPACGGGPLLFRPPDSLPPQSVVVKPPPSAKPMKRVQFAGQRLPSAPGETVLQRPIEVMASAQPSNYVPTVIEEVKEKIPDSPPAEPRIEVRAELTVPAPTEPDPPLVAAVRDLQAGRPDAADRLKPLPTANQELLLSLLPAVVRAAELNLAQPDLEETRVLARQFESAAATLTRKAGLTVSKAVLCLNVDGYGRYTPVRDRADLRRGALYPLYVEVGNVPCEPHTRADGADGYLTRLDVSMQVTDDLGRTMEIIDPRTGQAGPKSTSEKAEFSRSPVHDYHVIARLWTPTRPGVYTVTIEVRDPKGGRAVSRAVPFRVQ